MNRARTTTAALAAATLAAITTPALAAPPEYGLDFVTVGDPGNRAVTEAEAPKLFWAPDFEPYQNAGAVGYEFRIMRNEVTISQWGEFLEAYAPHYQGHRSNLNGLYHGINADNQFVYTPGTENHPAEYIGWHTAARYCNWLHNGKINEAWAFETGAYDTSHFQPNADGRYTDINVRMPGAKYWIPSVSEYIKAAYYDPNRYGQGEPGYWPYPHMSEVPVTPEESDVWFTSDENTPGNMLFNGPVGQYPEVQSPWGLLGVSGGAGEWFEDAIVNPNNGQSSRLQNASTYAIGDLGAYLLDVIDDWHSGASGEFGFPGIRIASTIPSPGVPGVLLMAALICSRRRR
ncbi:MAG: hypothetical protein EA378_02870 [Phycisphaerales bacterium]|nr:MAG: hypothetical protein EA378_02870 [Phycisphaerales bacterium]